MIFTPKRDFQEHADQLKAFRAIIDNPVLQEGIKAALLHYQDLLTHKSSNEPVESAANYHRSCGAREYVGVLLNLAELSSPSTARPDTGNLNHKA